MKNQHAIVVLTAILGLACAPTKKKPIPADAGAGGVATPYLAAGTFAPRTVHWTRGGDLLVVSASAAWRLPKGSLESGARIVDAPSAGEHTLVSVLDSHLPVERWLTGGNGFVTMRDPVTLAELARFQVEGTVRRVQIAATANVALATSCPSFCQMWRLDLDTRTAALLGPVYSEDAATLSPDGRFTVFPRDSSLHVVAGADPNPVFTGPHDEEGYAVAFRPDGTLLYGKGARLGRWAPGQTEMSFTALPVTVPESDAKWTFFGSSDLGVLVGEQSYGGKVVVYDGTDVRTLDTGGLACTGARPAVDDPSALECPLHGNRFDAAGAFHTGVPGPVLAVAGTTVLRASGQGCEVAERASGKILGWDRSLCSAELSPDGTKVAWVDATGALRIVPPGSVSDPEDGFGHEPAVLASVDGETFLARFENTAVALRGTDFRSLRFTLSSGAQGLGIGAQGLFTLRDQRAVGLDFTGAPQLRALHPAYMASVTAGTLNWFASGSAAVTNAYGGEDRQTLHCRFGAACTEVPIAPANLVESYEAPWIVSSTMTEPDAPSQTVYYLRHDEGREPMRRVIAGHTCLPPLLLEGGAKLVCPSDGKVLVFDTKTGAPIGTPQELVIPALLAPSSARPSAPARYDEYRPRGLGALIVGHGERSVFALGNDWLHGAVHLQEFTLPSPTPEGDAGALAPVAARGLAVIGPTFGVSVGSAGGLRLAGDRARAERLVLCRRGGELLPFAACR